MPPQGQDGRRSSEVRLWLDGRAGWPWAMHDWRKRLRTITTGYQCSRYGAVEVIGRTDNHYTVTFTESGPVCTCKGFTYRSTCYHLELAEKSRCTWRAAVADVEGGKPSGCPFCGAAVVPIETRMAAEASSMTLTITITIASSGAMVASAS